MPTQKVLIIGAGVAGSIAAFWLAKHDYTITVIERSRSEQKVGQGIEIEEPATQIVKMMGIHPQLEAVRTGELGFQVEDESGARWCRFEAGKLSPTGELELMRGDLTEVLYRAADQAGNVTYHFETTVQSIVETGEKVVMELQNRKDGAARTEEYDFVIGADGARSKTRQLIMGPPEQLNYYKRVGAYVAYFSIKREAHDWPYSRLCHFPGRRIVWMRPTTKDADTTSVYLIHLNDNIPALHQANAAGDRQKQKEAFAELFSGLGWETPRVIEQMMKAQNFYSDELQQVKLPTWSQGRVVLLGDSAWAPTPFTGQGNHLAILGAWTLAQEMSRDRTTAAFANYEKRFRAYVENAQEIPLGGYAPYLVNPETSLGIWVCRSCLLMLDYGVRFFRWSGLGNWLPKSAEDQIKHEDFDLQVDQDGMMNGNSDLKAQ